MYYISSLRVNRQH